MKKINVELEHNSYPIIVTNTFKEINEYVNSKENKCIIVTDRNVEKLYLEELLSVTRKGFKDVLTYVVEAGENSKSLDIAKDLYTFLIQHTICRNDVIMTLGGGVIGDLGGFVAATFLRGLKWVQVPTTLLAQVDSSIGGKTAVNLLKIKNAIGSFYQPILVYTNYSVLRTLSIDEIRNGLVEIIVHAIIKDADLFKYIEKNVDNILNLDADILEELIIRNCMIKKEIVQRDEKDLGERAVLNFGHTFGHAIESYYDYKYKHGECVALGIIGACYLAEELELIDEAVTKGIEELLLKINMLHQIHDCKKEYILKFLMHDKKFVGEKVYFILPLKLGEVIRREIDDYNLVNSTLDKLTEKKW